MTSSEQTPTDGAANRISARKQTTHVLVEEKEKENVSKSTFETDFLMVTHFFWK